MAVGGLALAANTSGQQNMAIGAEALAHNISSFNLAIGFRVGFMNTTGTNLTGIGAAALRNNTIGSDNTPLVPKRFLATPTPTETRLSAHNRSLTTMPLVTWLSAIKPS